MFTPVTSAGFPGSFECNNWDQLVASFWFFALFCVNPVSETPPQTKPILCGKVYHNTSQMLAHLLIQVHPIALERRLKHLFHHLGNPQKKDRTVKRSRGSPDFLVTVLSQPALVERWRVKLSVNLRWSPEAPRNDRNGGTDGKHMNIMNTYRVRETHYLIWSIDCIFGWQRFLSWLVVCCKCFLLFIVFYSNNHSIFGHCGVCSKAIVNLGLGARLSTWWTGPSTLAARAVQHPLAGLEFTCMERNKAFAAPRWHKMT